MMKKDATAFALAGAAMFSGLCAILNYVITPGVLWFFYPLFVAAWWPLSVYFCSRKLFLAYSVAGSVLTIAFLAVTNIVTSPQTLWFLYALLPILCWPVSMYFRRRMETLPFALLFSAVIILYYTAVNMLLSPGYFWAVYPIYASLWWPMSRYFTDRREFKKFAVAGALLTIAFFLAANLINPAHPWALYACFPVIWWPIAMYHGKRLGGLRFSILGTFCAIAWYSGLNILLSPACPWSIFIAFAALWWPLSVYYHGRGKALNYAAVMTAISTVFFAAVNYLFSPGALWAFYPVFVMLWWPMTLYFAKKHDWVGYAAAGSVLAIAFLAAVNLITSPGFPWSAFPALCILWWPLSAYFVGKKNPFGYAVGGSILAIMLFVTVNLLTSPGFLWCVFPIFAVLWWPLSLYFHSSHKRRLAK